MFRPSSVCRCAAIKRELNHFPRLSVSSRITDSLTDINWFVLCRFMFNPNQRIYNYGPLQRQSPLFYRFSLFCIHTRNNDGDMQCNTPLGGYCIYCILFLRLSLIIASLLICIAQNINHLLNQLIYIIFFCHIFVCQFLTCFLHHIA